MPAASTHRLVQLVIDSLGTPSVPRGGMRELARYGHLRQEFISAGIARMHAILEPEHWLQVGVMVNPKRTDVLLATHLLPVVERWLERGVVRDFFFMRKPPGVRLRFCHAGSSPQLRQELDAFLRTATDRSWIAGYELGLYEPETHQFGGQRGIELYHQHATADSIACLRARKLLDAGTAVADAPLLSLLMLNQVCSRVVGDNWELWDAWCNLSLTGRTLPEPARGAAAKELAARRDVLVEIVHEPARFIAELSAGEQALLRDHATAHDAWIRNVRDAVKREQLLWGMREILPFYAIFHWNRFGFSTALQSVLSYFMERVLDPRAKRARRDAYRRRKKSSRTSS